MSDDDLREMRGLAQKADLRLLSVRDMEKLIARQNTCIAKQTEEIKELDKIVSIWRLKG